jgi:Tol biopolymer transport system component
MAGIGPRTITLVLALSLLAVASCGGGAKGNGGDILLATGANGDLIQIVLPSAARSTVVHFDRASVLDPSISPDGASIAFVRSPDYTVGQTDFGTDIYVARRDGSDPAPLVKHASPSELLRWPVWLPDGKILIFQVQGASSAGVPSVRLDKVEVGTGTRSKYIDNALTPSLSRDGRTLAYITSDLTIGVQQIWVTDPVALSPQSIVKSSATIGAFGYVAPSPDGARIVFGAASLGALAPGSAPPARVSNPVRHGIDPTVLLTDGLPEDIWLVNRDGSGLKRLVALGEDQPSLAWSADGKTVYAMGGNGLWQIDAASGSKKKLDDGVFHGEIILAPRSTP